MAEDVMSDGFFEARLADLEGRVSPKRLRHIRGVADTAVQLARAYGCDEGKARLAGVLHDWDKGLRDKEIRRRARDLGVDAEAGEWVLENMPEVLHGPTAAAALAREYPGIPDDVLRAIRVHTTAAPEMGDLDMILYVADAIEPSRRFDNVEEMRGLIGEVPLDELFYRVYKFWTIRLIERDVVLHPDTIRIWNAIAEGKSKAKKERFA